MRETEKRKKKVIIKRSVCVCVVHLVSRQRSSCHQYSIPFRIYSMMYTFELFFHSFFLSPNRNIYETMDHVNNAARRSRERERRWKGGSSAFSSRTRWMGIVGKRKPTDQEEEEDDDWTNE